MKWVVGKTYAFNKDGWPIVRVVIEQCVKGTMDCVVRREGYEENQRAPRNWDQWNVIRVNRNTLQELPE